MCALKEENKGDSETCISAEGRRTMWFGVVGCVHGCVVGSVDGYVEWCGWVCGFPT